MPTPLTADQKRLLGFLSVATFFEGFDFLALSQILPSISAEFALTPGAAGALVAFVNVGAVLAWFLVRLGDRWGRRRVLTLTIAGYTLCTAATGLAPDIVTFAIAQLLARLFLLAEWGISMVYAAEEFPADRRGLALGVVQTAASVGSIACAAVVPYLLTTPWGWRAVFFVGIVPLSLLALARRSLGETRRFAREGPAAPRPILAIWSTPYAGRLAKLAILWGCTYACTQTSIAFWKEFAVGERGFDDRQVALALTVASLGALPLLAGVGKLLDGVGRRRGAVAIYALTACGVVGAYTLEGQWPLTVALVFGIFGASAVLPPLNAWTTELFPTSLRTDAYAWANYLLGRISYVLAPLIAGQAAGVWGWGPAVSATAVGPLIAIGLILWWMPETKGLELEETSRAS